MARMTFDDFLADVDKKHQSFAIDLPDGTSVEFRNLLRLPKEKRDEVQELFKKLSPTEEEAGQEEVDREVSRDEVDFIVDGLRLAASDDDQFTKFADLIGDDAAAWVELFTQWAGGTQAGEA